MQTLLTIPGKLFGLSLRDYESNKILEKNQHELSSWGKNSKSSLKSEKKKILNNKILLQKYMQCGTQDLGSNQYG